MKRRKWERVGVNYCVRHEGVANEDESVCDFAGHDDDMRDCEFVDCFIRRPKAEKAAP